MTKRTNTWRRRAGTIALMAICWLYTVAIVMVPDGAANDLVQQPMAVLQVLVGGGAALVVIRWIDRFNKEGVRSHLVAFGIYCVMLFLTFYLFTNRVQISEAGLSWVMTLTPLFWSFFQFVCFGYLVLLVSLPVDD